MNAEHKAKQWHDQAQKKGSAADYETAAYYYDQAGQYTKAQKCREAAERLKQAERAA